MELRQNVKCLLRDEAAVPQRGNWNAAQSEAAICLGVVECLRAVWVSTFAINRAVQSIRALNVVKRYL